MQYTVKKGRVEITVDTLGAELISVKVDCKERLWQNESGAWAGHAPVLFPVCGRSAVVKNGEKYILWLHGFARKTQFVFKDQGEGFISFSLTSDETTYKEFPYAFVFKVTYTLLDGGVKTTYTVENPAEETLYFSCGSHESFALDKDVGEYEIVFEKEENLVHYYHNDEGKLTGKTKDYGKVKNFPLPADFLSEGRTLIFKDVFSRKVTLQEKSGKEIAVFSYEQCGNLLLWRASANSKYICIEPWCNLPDYVAGKDVEFADKAGVLALEKGKSVAISREINYK